MIASVLKYSNRKESTKESRASLSWFWSESEKTVRGSYDTISDTEIKR